ncbi:hypothetical protein ACMXYN_10360 [Neptuniibacter sp. PT8_73]|uniref:hypothetical protein n=1 Tax=unclassified Neptuniibacter TaxID=2630693 RepID=UPI0039F69DDD
MYFFILFLIICSAFLILIAHLKPYGRRPTTEQRLSAKLWLYFRRTVSFLCSALIAFFAITVLFDLPNSDDFLQKLLGACLLLFLAATIFFFGIFGKKDRYSSLKEDIEAHKIRKEYFDRY